MPFKGRCARETLNRGAFNQAVSHAARKAGILHRVYPHLHAVMSAGGLSPDGARWITKKGAYLFPVKVMAKRFRGKFRALLLAALTKGTVTLPEACGPNVLNELRRAQHATNWVVYAKAPFGGAAQVYAYRWARHPSRGDLQRPAAHRRRAERDLRDEDGPRSRCPARSFCGASWSTCCPMGFTRIRHDGLLDALPATTTLEHARVLLTPPPTGAPTALIPRVTPAPSTWQERSQRITGEDATRCAHCGEWHIVRVALAQRAAPEGWDTS
jgi:Putative transposase